MTLKNYFRLLAENRSFAARGTWFWKPVLSFLSFFYALSIKLRSFFYQVGMFKPRTFACPVISVGNITWGGTGKTPLSEYIARFFVNRANVPLILSRGYGADETKMLVRQLKGTEFGIGKNRYEIGRKICSERKIDVIVLDDGFQHWGIKRDLDIVAINVLNPFGNSSLIPRGILREPITALKRASIIVLADVNLTPRKELETLKSKIRAIAPKVDFIEAHREGLYFYRPGSRERIPLDRLAGKRVTSFAGIGTPRSFQMLLNQLGIKVIRNFEFCDHHPFTVRELEEILKSKQSSESEEIITTEKDYYRSEETIKRILNPLILKVRLRLTNGEALLHQYLSRHAVSRPFETHQMRNPQRFRSRGEQNRKPNFTRPQKSRITVQTSQAKETISTPESSPENTQGTPNQS